jgi:hypothetical protein
VFPLLSLKPKLLIQVLNLFRVVTRCMLCGIRLGHEFWAEAVGTTCYLVNQSPSRIHIGVFSCDAYVHIPKENRSKLDKRV